MSLPSPINHQDFLLTINTQTEPLIKDVLPGVDIWPLFLSPEQGLWIMRAKFKPGTTLPKHFHTGTVNFYTLAGCWYYLEYPNEKQTAGSYLYEPGGSIHTFHCPEDSPEGADGFMIVEGSNVNFDDDGNFVNVMDAGWIEEMIIKAAKAQGITMPRYIKPKAQAGFSNQ